MKKIIVIGCPGSGKSTFSKKINTILNLPLYHLDMMYYNEDSTHITGEEFLKKMSKIFEKESWIIDGNYQKTLEIRIKECDTIFLFDISTDLCIKGVESRVGVKRSDLPWIEEKIEEDFKNEIINFKEEKIPKIYELIEQYKNEKEIIIFKSREESDKYIENLKLVININ